MRWNDRLNNKYTKISCLLISKQRAKEEIKKAIPFTATSRRVRNIGTNFKKVNYLYKEICKTLLKERRKHKEM